MTDNSLIVDNISKRFKDVTALDNISMSIAPGEIIGLVGPTGAGKSTLIKLLGGLVMPDSGNVEVCGVSLYQDFERCMSTVGIVPDKPEFYSYLSGYRNLQVFAKMYKGVSGEIIDELVRELSLENYIDMKVGTYPAGVRTRLAIAAALLPSPSFLIMDEIMAVLDPISVIGVRKLLRSLAAEHGVGVVISANHMTEVERVCDTLAIIDKGQLIGVGSIEKIKQANSSKSRHRMMLDRPDEAALYLNENAGVGVEVRGDKVIVDAEQNMIPKLVSMLFARGFLVYEVAGVETTLEDAYIRMLRSRAAETRGGTGGGHA